MRKDYKKLINIEAIPKKNGGWGVCPDELSLTKWNNCLSKIKQRSSLDHLPSIQGIPDGGDEKLKW
jgi:hypothetical protein